MKKLSLIIAAVLFSFGSVIADDSNSDTHQVGITISEVALVDVETTAASKNISFTPAAPTEAGEGLTFTATNSDLWLNYSSIVASGTSRSISAVVSGTLPEGVTISVATSDPASSGKGKKGNAKNAAQVVTNGSGVEVVTGIGSCYTGDGASNGCNLTYSLNLEDTKYDKLYHETYTAVITYTISDEN